MNKAVRIAGFAVVAAFAACQDGPVAAPPTEQLPLLARGQVQALVRQERGSDGLITFIVRVRANDVGVNAYQGAVTFEPGAYELVVATTPQGDGGSHILNSGGFADGRIRFAAFAPLAFAGTDVGEGVEALRFTVRPTRPGAELPVEATLDVVSQDGTTPVTPVSATQPGV